MKFTSFYNAQGEDAEKAISDFQDMSGNEFLDAYGETEGETVQDKPWSAEHDTFKLGLFVVFINWQAPSIGLAKVVS